MKKKIKPLSRPFMKLNRKLAVKKKPDYSQTSPAQCNTISSKSGSIAPLKNIENNTKYYSLVIRTEQGWRYLQSNWQRTGFYITPLQVLYPQSEIENLAYIWKRLVLDGSIIIEAETRDSYSLSTVRIIEVISNVSEYTSNIFGDEDEYKMAMKRSAMAKLNSEEVKALGLETEFFQHSFLSNNKFCTEDSEIIQEMDLECLTGVTLDKILDELMADIL